MEFFTHQPPWVRYSLFGVVGIGLVWILYSRLSGGGDTVTTQATDPGLVQLQAQENQLTAQAQAQQNQANYALAADAQKSNAALASQNSAQEYNLKLASENNSASINLANLQIGGQTQLAQINRQNIQDSLAAQTTQQQNNLAAMVSLANLSQSTQIHLSDNQTQVTLAQTEANRQVQMNASNNTASVEKKNSSNNLIGKVIGGVIGGLF